MPSEVVHDPRMLRAIAHPVRTRILGELTASGTARAADIARELDIPANQASFHLRQLAKYGVVEEDAGAGRDGRDRVWRLTHPEGFVVNLNELAKEPGGGPIVDVYKRTIINRANAIVAAAMTDSDDHDRHQMISDHSLKLTHEEAKQVATELDELLRGWADRTRGREESRRTYLVFQVLTPYPDGV